jgi:hypothetical protein
MDLDLHRTTVTRELGNKDSPLRTLLKPHQTLLDQWRTRMITGLSGKPWIRPARTRLAWMSGHAIDYRIRWWLTGITELPDAVLAGLTHCDDRTMWDLVGAFETVAGTRAGVLDAELERAVCTVAVAASSVEPLYRAGAVPCALRDLGLGAFTVEYADVIDDVVALTAGLPLLVGDFAGGEIVAGPVVGVGRLAGDADLLANGQLVEIKCVVDPRASATRAVQQLLVYSARLKPESAAIVLPRQHTRVVLSLADHRASLERLDRDIKASYALV